MSPMANGTPNALRTWVARRMATYDDAPRSKKFSSRPILGRPSSALHMAMTCSSVEVAAERSIASPSCSLGTTKARRSSLPLLVTGKRSRKTKVLGTMYPARREPEKSCSSALGGAASLPPTGWTKATRYLELRSPSASTTAVLTLG